MMISKRSPAPPAVFTSVDGIRRKDGWEKADIFSRSFGALWAVPALLLVQDAVSRAHHEDHRIQAAKIEQDRRFAEAELANRLMPSLLRAGPERNGAVTVLAAVAPKLAENVVSALDAAGEPLPA